MPPVRCGSRYVPLIGVIVPEILPIPVPRTVLFSRDSKVLVPSLRNPNCVLFVAVECETRMIPPSNAAIPCLRYT